MWLLIGLQCAIAGINVVAYASGAPLMLLLVTDWVLAVLWQAQLLILSTATRSAGRASMSGLWLGVAGVTVAAVVAARLI